MKIKENKKPSAETSVRPSVQPSPVCVGSGYIVSPLHSLLHQSDLLPVGRVSSEINRKSAKQRDAAVTASVLQRADTEGQKGDIHTKHCVTQTRDHSLSRQGAESRGSTCLFAA